MNPFIRYKLFNSAYLFKTTSFRKMKKYPPIKNSGVKHISISQNRACINMISNKVNTHEKILAYIENGKIPEFLYGHDYLYNMTCHSLFLWMNSHMANYMIDPDIIQCANVDELTKYLGYYRKSLVKIYKKYADEALDHILKTSIFLNQFNNGSSHNEFNVLYNMLKENEPGSPEIENYIKGELEESALGKLKIEYIKGKLAPESFEKSLISDKIPKSLLSIYLRFSFLNGNSSKVVNKIKDNDFSDIIDYHIDSIVERIQDFCMITNSFPVYDGARFTEISHMDVNEKTKVISRMALERSNVDNIVTKMNNAKLDSSDTVRYNANRVLNYIKLKKGIDKVDR